MKNPLSKFPQEWVVPAVYIGGVAVLTLVVGFNYKTPQTKLVREPIEKWDRSESGKCYSNSFECKRWTRLAMACDKKMAQRADGYLGRLEPYCSRAEEYREVVSGVELSTAPVAYNF